MAANVRDQRREEGAWDVIKTVLQALLLAFLVRTFLFQPFNIPSGSMYPTLMIGDYLFVSKLSYGYSKYSFNFSIDRLGVKFGPVPIDGRVFFAEQPERGDVVVFKLPADNETDYIKRLIGLPGDRRSSMESSKSMARRSSANALPIMSIRTAKGPAWPCRGIAKHCPMA
jgi:signal peptidase I